MSATILQFPLQGFVHNLFEAAKNKQDEIIKGKTNFLYREVYKYFLDSYLMRTAKENVLDFPPFMYETGLVLCEEARYKTERVMLRIIKDGRINQCYTKRIKELRKQQKGF